ncbi:MAG: hypothetical protein ACK5LC_14895 [Coprobacillaceae bacterium]
MKIVRLRFKKGIKKSIRPTQKMYYYYCPIPTISVGQYVLVETKKGYSFEVARIEEVVDAVSEELLATIDSFVVCLLPVKDFVKRCKNINKQKSKIRNI